MVQYQDEIKRLKEEFASQKNRIETLEGVLRDVYQDVFLFENNRRHTLIANALAALVGEGE